MSLVDLGLLKKGNMTGMHPLYRLNVASKKFAALSLLAYAVLDDRDGSDCMAEALHDYYSKVVREKYEPIAIATTAYYSPLSLPGMPGGIIRIGPGMYSGSV